MSFGTDRNWYLNFPHFIISLALLAALELPIAIKSGPAMEQNDFRWSPASTGIAVTGYLNVAVSWSIPSYIIISACSNEKAVHVHNDLRKMFITLVWKDQ